MGKFLGHIIFPIGLILSLPLLGVLLSGQSVMPYLKFPPKPVITAHAPFCLPVFMAFILFILLATMPFVKKGITHKGKNPGAAGRLPWWGYVSFSGLGCFWIMAWTRFDWFSFFQPHTFFPLWTCWIICVNALVYRSKNQCPLLKVPCKFLFLFIVSALFWWIFEYLNRFVGNWHYSGSQYPAGLYFLLATLSFSTVLPAVESMKEYLMTFDRFKNAFKHYCPLPGLNSRLFALGAIVVSCIFLILMAVFPDAFFPLVWICPFFIFSGCQVLFNQNHILADAAKGDATRVVAYAAAALICGFFWEMFNLGSFARWQYTIPFVDVLHLFEMPILGYAGYLPFGLECALIIDLVMKHSRQ
jgi:hypothetical protein